MYTCSKKYANLPFAHRQHNHAGHCRFIHGHNWAFEFTFGCRQRDKNGFVIDFGDLKWLKEWLEKMFDHTLVLNLDDPALEYLRCALLKTEDIAGVPGVSGLLSLFPFADLRTVPNAGAEGLAGFVFESVDVMLRAKTDDRVFLVAVTVHEDEKNYATYSPEVCHHG